MPPPTAATSVDIGAIDINTGGSSIRYLTTSDRRMKNEHGPIIGAIDRLRQLIPRRYSWKGDPEDTVMEGFFADEVQEVIPSAVSGQPDDTNEDGSIKPQQLEMAQIVPLLVAALQEAMARIEALEAR